MGPNQWVQILGSKSMSPNDASGTGDPKRVTCPAPGLADSIRSDSIPVRPQTTHPGQVTPKGPRTRFRRHRKRVPRQTGGRGRAFDGIESASPDSRGLEDALSTASKARPETAGGLRTRFRWHRKRVPRQTGARGCAFDGTESVSPYRRGL